MSDSSKFEQFKKLVTLTTLPEMSSAERKACSILLVDSEPHVRGTLRQSLLMEDFDTVIDATDHALALTKIEARPVTHVIFEAKRTNMPAREFLQKTLEYDSRIIPIASSYEPTMDDVFDLLINGARGYLVKPFTPANVSDSIVMATKGEPISEALLYAKDRNEALASLMMTAFDKLATTTRQADLFETARRELPKLRMSFKRAVDIGRTFAQGGDPALLDSLIDFCTERSNGPATRLGRVRARRQQRARDLREGSTLNPLSQESGTPPEDDTNTPPAEPLAPSTERS